MKDEEDFHTPLYMAILQRSIGHPAICPSLNEMLEEWELVEQEEVAVP